MILDALLSVALATAALALLEDEIVSFVALCSVWFDFCNIEEDSEVGLTS